MMTSGKAPPSKATPKPYYRQLSPLNLNAKGGEQPHAGPPALRGGGDLWGLSFAYLSCRLPEHSTDPAKACWRILLQVARHNSKSVLPYPSAPTTVMHRTLSRD